MYNNAIYHIDEALKSLPEEDCFYNQLLEIQSEMLKYDDDSLWETAWDKRFENEFLPETQTYSAKNDIKQCKILLKLIEKDIKIMEENTNAISKK